ncbi:hypothetical protein [Lactobacillus sp.]|uniref:hypothetical protein n=1 Tax=Lactobacillus sp. TaxID=1591 RepID=UPI003EF17620
MEYQVMLNHERNIGMKQGEKRGKEEALVENLRSLVNKGKTPTEAFDLLDVPEANRPKLLKLIEPQNV